MSSNPPTPSTQKEAQAALEPPAGCLWAPLLSVVALSIFLTCRLGGERFGELYWAGRWTSFKVFLAVVPICILVPLLTLAVARWRRKKIAKVFVSYPHEKGEVAAAIAAALDRQPIEADMIPFVDRPNQHNEVISEVLTHLRAADLLVVVTAPAPVGDEEQRARFYESEILAAAALFKPVILLGSEGSFRLPSTAYQGYPVFGLEKLQKTSYANLAAMVHYAVGTRTAVGFAFESTLHISFLTLFAIAFVLGLVSWALIPPLMVLALATAALIQGSAGVAWSLAAFENLLSAVLIVLGAGGLLLAFLRRLRDQLRLQEILREDMAKRRMTNSLLASLLGDFGNGGQIVSCLLELPAPAMLPAGKDVQ